MLREEKLKLKEAEALTAAQVADLGNISAISRPYLGAGCRPGLYLGYISAQAADLGNISAISRRRRQIWEAGSSCKRRRTSSFGARWPG